MDIGRHFDTRTPGPHMLYFQRVKSSALQAITHVDGSARIQSVTPSENPSVHALLTAFKNRTGYGVLCNTSLNFKGAGFINRLSDLVTCSEEHGLDGFVMQNVFFRRKKAIVADAPWAASIAWPVRQQTAVAHG